MRFERKVCDKFHIKLNMGAKPIANKYRKGKMKSSLEKELKVLEIVRREAFKMRGVCVQEERLDYVSSARFYYLKFSGVLSELCKALKRINGASKVLSDWREQHDLNVANVLHSATVILIGQFPKSGAVDIEQRLSEARE